MKDKKGLKYKLQCVFYAVLIISLIYGLMGKAKADSVDYSEEMWTQVQSDMVVYMTNNSSFSASGAAAEYANSQSSLGAGSTIAKYVRLVSKDDSQVIYYFSHWDSAIFTSQLYSHWDTSEPITNAYIGFNSYTDTIGMSLTPSDGTRWYYLGITSNGCRMGRCGGNSITSSTTALLINDNTTMSFYTNNNWLSNGYRYGNNIDIGAYFDFTDCVCKGNCYIYNPYNLIYQFQGVPEYVSDDRLRLYTINTNVGKDLIVDLDEFDFTNQDGTESATQNILDGGRVMLTIDYDGNSRDVVLDSSTSEFLPDMLIETPYSFFGLDEYTTVQITGVSFSKIIHYRPSEMKEDEKLDFYISCSYYLKNDVSEIVPEDIPYDDNTNTAKITQIEYDEVMGKINFQDGHYSPMGGGGNPLVVPEGYDVMYVNITGSRTLASIVNEIVYYNMIEMCMFHGPDVAAQLTSYLLNEVWESVQGVQSTADAEKYIYEHLRTNDYSQEFDIIVYYWAPDSSLGEVDCMYYYLTTCGRLRGISQTLADIWKECNQTAYNTSAIYDYMYDRLGNMINVSAEYFNKMAFSDDNLMGSLISWNQSIYNKMDDVITAIKSIKLDSLDVTINGILTTSSLTSTLQYLFIPSYDGFQDTFDDSIDKLGILALPYTVTSDFISACKVPYQSQFSVTMPDYSLPMSENINGNVVSYDMPVWDEYTFSLDVGSVVGSDWLSFLQYCNALFVLVGVTLLTYKHIFVSSAQEESGVL